MKGSTLAAVAFAALAVLSSGIALAVDKGEENPHERMLKSKSVCIDCHTRVPAAGAHVANYLLVDTPSESCLGCHGEHEHAGVAEHMGKDAQPLPGDENGKIACFTCHDPHPAGVIEGRTVYTSDVGASTRALAAARELPPGAKRSDEERKFGALLRFPVANGEGCLTCHENLRGDAKSWRERTLWDKFIYRWPH